LAPFRLADVVHGIASGERTDLVGAPGGAAAWVIARAAKGLRFLCVTPDEEAARRLEDDLAAFAGESVVLRLPSSENSPFAELAADRPAEMLRLAVLAHLATDRPWSFLVVPAAALVRRVVPKKALAARIAVVRPNQETSRDVLARLLSESGYLPSPLVEDPGTFALRGGLVDVFSPGAAQPVRIELYGDLIESIRAFDPETQRTRRTDPLPEVVLVPAREAWSSPDSLALAKERILDACDAINVPSAQTRSLLDDLESGRPVFGVEALLPAFHDALDSIDAYLPAGTATFVEDPPHVLAAMRGVWDAAPAEREARLERRKPTFDVAAHLTDPEEIVAVLTEGRCVFSHVLPVAGGHSWEAPEGEPIDLAGSDHAALRERLREVRSIEGREGATGPLAQWLASEKAAGRAVVVTARSTAQAERTLQILRGLDRSASLREGPLLAPVPDPGPPVVQVSPLARGFTLPGERVSVVPEEEVFGERRRAARRKRETLAGETLLDLGRLQVGDLVVHQEFGIGRSLGLVRRAIGGVEIDFLLVEYAGRDKLYVPVYRLSLLAPYVGGDAAGAKLDRLGGDAWAERKNRVRRAVREMAEGLLRLYAERRALPGHRFPAADAQFAEFEARFPFEETPDQARAIGEALGDMEAGRSMDRLVCGDVGFGKTEVALRAAFRAVQGGKQVAVLVPTTVLAEQHGRTFRDRLRGQPVLVEVLSRFRSKKEQEDIVRRLREGKLDVVVGTHRLLSKDVHFKSLGLVVVDEEHRFGVVHKERLKVLCTSVDVLTLTATPIPRTLHMAMSGLRDLSLIATPPADRRAIRTLVTQMDEPTIQGAIERELARGGQVFYVYNRIEEGKGSREGDSGIEAKAALVRRLVPKARVTIAHGKLSEEALEKVMLDFVRGDFDVLVTTAIVESGLDIPRANTMIVDGAQLLGLAQAHQLRGRIGRSRERAYCYLVVPPPTKLTEEARQRVDALTRYSELGSGFQIATLDLEIRGAGNLLGGEQSGHVAAVGFETYVGMLEEAVAELKGEPPKETVDPELTFDVSGFLPDDYVESTSVRLQIYSRLASAPDRDEITRVQEEMEDRFGALPPEARALLRAMAVKVVVRRLGGLGLEATADRVVLHLSDSTPLPPEKVLQLVNRKGSAWRLSSDMRLTARKSAKDGIENAEIALEELEALV